MVSFSTLKRIAAVGGLLSIGGAVYLTEKLQENFRKELYYRKSMTILRKYRPAIEKLGEPIVSKKIDLGNTTENRVDGFSAKLLIPVKGPNGKANLYVQASRPTPKESWDIDQLDLELKNSGTRWTFYAKSENSS